MEKPVYIVSGYMRSGTSMMMKALQGAGLAARYNSRKDEVLGKKYGRGDYHPNPEGFFELGRGEFDDPGFPGMFDGELIKVLHWRLKGLPVHRYRICFMTRDPKEIEVSYLKMFQRRPPFVLQRYHELVEAVVRDVKARGDSEILPVAHAEMLSDPAGVLTRLCQAGWPVTDIEKGAAQVDRSLYRSRPETLDEVRKTVPNLRTDMPDCLSS
ncbi:hypothetical protein [Desulfoluna sp.]|uniref:hypothetical protein n=1 Tax=Desulfoluna sp. TaxID=2045199 RepID=UPI002638C3FB|nr:hypothetical protein [Desulfoluna sp.]